MISFLIDATIFLAVLGVMILVHEAGHFIMARRFNVKVLEFAFGIGGPTLFSRKKGETLYLVKSIPFGGYVKMLGESSDDMDGEEITPEDRKRSFAAQTPFKRFCIVFAGPFMNIVLALILAPMFYMIGINEPAYLKKQPVVDVLAEDSAAERAGLMKHDLILEINSKPVDTWEDVMITVMLSPEVPLEFKVNRGGELLILDVTPDKDERTKAGDAGILPYSNLVEVKRGYPAQKAGMEDGDRIVAINGQKVIGWSDIPDLIGEHTGGALSVKVLRGDKEMTLPVIPVSDDGRYIIGISPKMETVVARYGPIKAVKMGFIYVIDNFFLIFIVIKKLISGVLSLGSVGGPIMIAQITSAAASLGISHLLKFMALISLNFGVINLLPLPALDGGHIMFSLAEAISRRKLNPKRLDMANQIGFVLLITLMVVITVNDIIRSKAFFFDIFDKIKGLF